MLSITATLQWFLPSYSKFYSPVAHERDAALDWHLPECVHIEGRDTRIMLMVALTLVSLWKDVIGSWPAPVANAWWPLASTVVGLCKCRRRSGN